MRFDFPAPDGRCCSLATALVASVLVACGAERPGQAEADREHLASGLSIRGTSPGRGRAAFNERGGKVWSKRSGATRRGVRAPLSDLFVTARAA